MLLKVPNNAGKFMEKELKRHPNEKRKNDDPKSYPS
jgi:hypothetical protein